MLADHGGLRNLLNTKGIHWMFSRKSITWSALPVREPPTLLASSLDGMDEGEEGEADLDSLEC